MWNLEQPRAVLDVRLEPKAISFQMKLDATRSERLLWIGLLGFFVVLAVRTKHDTSWFLLSIMFLAPVLLLLYQIIFGKSVYWGKLTVTASEFSYQHNAGFLARKVKRLSAEKIQKLVLDGNGRRPYPGLYAELHYPRRVCVLPYIDREQTSQVRAMILKRFPQYGGSFNPFQTEEQSSVVYE